MKKKIFHWLGREFIALSCEGKSQPSPSEEAKNIFLRFAEELKRSGLSLEDTVRTRLWARDRESRSLASDERFKILSGKARSSSSSFIAPDHFNSDARVGMDLIAMRPSRSGLERTIVEYDPPMRPCRYVAWDTFVFLTGEEAKNALQPVLSDQLDDILSMLTGSLAHAKVSWDHVVQVSCFLHRSQHLETLKELFEKNLKTKVPNMEYAFVDDYALTEGLLEVEVTARRQ